MDMKKIEILVQLEYPCLISATTDCRSGRNKRAKVDQEKYIYCNISNRKKCNINIVNLLVFLFNVVIIIQTEPKLVVQQSHQSYYIKDFFNNQNFFPLL